MENEPLRVSVADGVATVVIDRVPRKNAISLAMWKELAAIFRRLSLDPDCRVVVLSGAGGDFSAGADIAEFETLRAGPDAARAYEAANSAAFAAVREVEVPVIAAIRGICFGGGFGLAAACDLRIGATDAVFCLPVARLGLSYPQDAVGDIVGSAGLQLASYLAFTAERIDAARALSAGFLLEIVSPFAIVERAALIAATIAANAPLSIRASKAAFRAAAGGSEALRQAAGTLGDATFGSHDYAEGRAAFAERRKPRFEGR